MTTATEVPVVLVNITDKAAEKALALLAARELPEGALRVFVAGGSAARDSCEKRSRIATNAM